MKHITIVYTILDAKVFGQELNRLEQEFELGEIADRPWAITAMSSDHEIRRLELIEEAVADEDIDLVNAVLSHNDIGNIKSLEEL